ncbi:LuxR C-terminal-related transcriptional regulator [Aquabacterium humicola]|uniref:LuxR C-terminal-related transcriptional regulator n=1 Tax=Aquabacterium humicola TaxID=3237377 RepID=UPI0025439C23|nr:LuxR C-terminal-related transcriptional regulator [Rubrivivax pictus]
MASDAFNFARTKIQPPRLRAGLLLRAALAERIAGDLLHARLTLISAPGGFGKSSAIVQALETATARGQLRFAWIACDDGDTLARLATALVAALEPFDLPWRLSPEALIGALDRPDGQRGFRDALVNALAATELPRGVIVLDDVHRLTDERLLEFLATLPPLLPEHWGLAMITRVDPPWPLARLRASGELAEFRQDDLRFGAGEIEALAARAGPGLSEAPDELLARTEGWPVGVSLAIAGPRTASPVRSARHAIDYLRSEVLDHLPADLRSFLVATSVLPELTAARAAAVSARADAAACLDDIERRGLFYQEVDSIERTLKLHDLFRDALQAERERLPGPEQDALWRRAADSEPDITRRFHYLMQARAHDAAVQALTRAAPALAAAGMIDAVREMLAKLPPELLAQSPDVALLRGMVAWEVSMDLEAMLGHMKHAAREFAARGDVAGNDLARAYAALAVNGMSPIGAPQVDPAFEVTVTEATPPLTRAIVALHRAWHAFDLADFESTNRHYGELLDQLANHRDVALWYQIVPGVAYFGVRALEPMLQRYAAGALRAAGEDYPALRAVALAIRGCTQLWRGEFAEARTQLDEAASLCAWVNFPQGLSLYALTGRLVCRTMQGEIDAALAAYHDELPRVSDVFGDDGRGPGWYFHWFELRCAVMAERRDLTRSALEALRRTMPASTATSHVGVVRVIEAYTTWLDGDLATAAAQMQAVQSHYRQHDAVGIVTALTLQRAGLLQQLGRSTDAGRALQEALDGIRQRGYPVSAHFAGAALLQRLADGAAADMLDDAQRAILRSIVPMDDDDAEATLSRAPATVVAPPGPDELGGIEPMSARELEVLALIAAGDSNKLIARRLDLSPHTVKRHVANILGKLGVGSRGQAAARYLGVNRAA